MTTTFYMVRPLAVPQTHGTASDPPPSCGNNYHGQCGFDPDECEQTSTPFKVAAFDGVGVCQIAAGFQHSLFLADSGTVFSSGSNADMQLGIGDQPLKTVTPVEVKSVGFWRIKQIAAGYHSACISVDGELFLWGKGIFGEYPYPQKILTISNPVVDVSLGRSISTAIDDQGLAWTWGSNKHGEIGVGDYEPRVHPFPLLNLKGKTVTKVCCGDQFTICLGKKIKKEIPNLNLTTAEVPQRQDHSYEQVEENREMHQRKKSAKRRKRSVESKKSTSKSAISRMSNNRTQQDTSSGAARKPRAQDAKMQTFGHSSRHPSHERNPSFNARKQHKPSVAKRPSQERANHSHIVHQPNRTAHNFSLNNSTTCTGVISPKSSNMSGTVKQPLVTHANDALLQQYRDNYVQANSQIQDLKGTIKSLRASVRQLKDEKQVLKTENIGKSQIIEKLEKERQDQNQTQVIMDLQSDIKRKDMKLRKMKERRNIYRDEKESLQQQLGQANERANLLQDQIQQMQEGSHNMRQENAKLQHQLQRAEGDLKQLEGEVTGFQEQVITMRDSSKAVEMDFVERLRQVDQRNNELEQEQALARRQNEELKKELAKLQRQQKTEEAYMINLENEAIMLRDEIKRAKFNNEKGGYDRFVNGLTQIKSRDRSRSQPGANGLRDSSVSNERLAQRDNYVRQREQDASVLSLSGKRGSSTSPATRLNRNLRATARPCLPTAIDRDMRNHPVAMLTAEMPDQIHTGHRTISDFQDEKPTTTFQYSVLKGQENHGQSTFTAPDGYGDSQLGFTKATRETGSEQGPKEGQEQTQDPQNNTFINENPLSTLKQSELGPMRTQDLLNQDVKQELAVQNLSNPVTQPTLQATTPSIPDEKTIQPNTEDTGEKEKTTKVPAGAIDLRDKYKEHLMKRFDTKIIRKRQARMRGEAEEEE